jgi:predicted dehydrogenase
MADKVNIGIIGAGMIGKYHLETYAKIPEAQVVAVCDIREDEAKSVAAKYGVKHVLTDYHKLLAMDEIQSVDVCVHNFLHAPITIDALKAGKHVYCEKPIAPSYKEAKRMVETAGQSKRKLAVQLVTLHEPCARAAKKVIDEGKLGRIYYAKTSHYRRRGRPFVDGYGMPEFVNPKTGVHGAVCDMSVYHTGRILWLLGNPGVLTVSGATYQELDNMYEDRRKSSGYGVEEFGMALVRLEGGITLFLEEAWACHMDSGDGDRIFGSRGGLKLDPFTYFTTMCDIEVNASADDLEDVDLRWHRCIPGTGDVDEPQRHWISALLGRCELIDTAGITLKASLIFDGIFLSQKLGREVTTAEIDKL